MSAIELIATTAFGLEAVVAREVKQLGYDDMTTTDGKVMFRGDATAIARANLWLRSADRILVKMGEFEAKTFDQLFEGTKALNWSEWLPEDAEFPVDGKSVKSTLTSVPACQGIVKKAIVSNLQSKYKKEWFQESGALFPIMVSIHKDIATLTLDTTGIGLHKRGYRQVVGNAPLKETLAAALIQLSRWHPDRPFVDPLCGSGTLPIEAALIGRNIAPGLERSFTAEKWARIPEQIWKDAREEARDVMRPQQALQIFGSDIEAEQVGIARYHARAANLDGVINWEHKALVDLSPMGDFGCLVTNPPYGERVGDVKEVEKLYRDMGKTFTNVLGPSWSAFILTSNAAFERLYGKKADKKRKLYNGRIECHLYQYLRSVPWPKNLQTSQR